MNITQKYLPPNTLRRPSIPILGVKFIVCHDTDNDGSTALQNVDYYIRSANETEASAHAFVDDKGVIECIPLNEKAYHVRRVVSKDNEMFSADAIDYSLGVEICYSTKGIFDSKLAYNNYVEYIKGLCAKYGLDPRKHVVGHYTLDPTRRSDPINAFSKIGKDWTTFINDLSAKPDNEKDKIYDSILTTLQQLSKLIGELKSK